MAYVSAPVAATDFQAGITAGTGFLYGDNATSDPGASIGLTYELLVTPYLNLGINTNYQRFSGESEITDISSIFYGFHEYNTSFLMGELSARLQVPNRIIKPYLSFGAGESIWVPGKNDDIDSLPMKRKISWSSSPFFSLGTGVSVHMGQHWILDIGAKGTFFNSDELDNVDGGYVSGGTPGNDFTMQAGFSIVYRFGGEPDTGEKVIPAPSDTVPELPDESKVPADESAREPIEPAYPEPDEQLRAPTTPEPDTAAVEIDTTPITEPAESDTISIAAPDARPPLPTEIPTVTPPTPRPSQQQRTESRSYLVHVASFPTSDEAERQATALRSAGYRTRMNSVDRGEIGIWYRVYVGPFAIRAEAEQTAERLIQAGLSDYAAVIEEEE